MRFVTLAAHLPVPVGDAWVVVDDIESYPAFMPHLQAARILADGPGTGRIADWTLAVGGRTIGWTEWSDRIPGRLGRESSCLDGDLGFMAGRWVLTPGVDGTSVVSVSLDLEADDRRVQDVFVRDVRCLLDAWGSGLGSRRRAPRIPALTCRS